MQRLAYQIPVPSDGLRKDLPPNECPPTALIDSSNMVFRRGRFQPRYGLASFATDASSPVRGVATFGPTIGFGTAGGIGDRVVVGCDNGWYRYNAGVWTAISGASLSASKHVIFRIFHKNNSNYLIGLNAGIDIAKVWDGQTANAAVDLGGSPPKAKAMMILANRLMLFNLTASTGYTGVLSPVGYDVSAFNDFDSGWSSTLNGMLVDTPGDIVGAMEMGDLQGAIYKSDAIIMAVAQGGIYPYHFELRATLGVGPANSRCIMSIQDGSHLFLGQDGAVYRFDGVSVRSLGYAIQKAILDSCDRDLTSFAPKSFGFYDRTRNEAIFYFKGDGFNVVTGVVINLDNLSVWPISTSSLSTNDLTAGGMVQIPSATRPEIVLFSDATGKSWREHAGILTDNSAAITCSWIHPLSDMGTPGSFKTLTDVYHYFQFGTDDPDYATTGTQDILVAATGTVGQYASLESSQTFTIGSSVLSQHQTDHRVTAQNFSLSYVVSASKQFEFRGALLNAVARADR